jgi:hypothetical protein
MERRCGCRWTAAQRLSGAWKHASTGTVGPESRPTRSLHTVANRKMPPEARLTARERGIAVCVRWRARRTVQHGWLSQDDRSTGQSWRLQVRRSPAHAAPCVASSWPMTDTIRAAYRRTWGTRTSSTPSATRSCRAIGSRDFGKTEAAKNSRNVPMIGIGGASRHRPSSPLYVRGAYTAVREVSLTRAK